MKLKAENFTHSFYFVKQIFSRIFSIIYNYNFLVFNLISSFSNFILFTIFLSYYFIENKVQTKTIY